MGALRGGVLVMALVAAFVPCAAPAQTAGQPTSPVAVPLCRDVLDASERLRCYDEDANFDFAAVVLRELECDRPPKAAEVLKLLIRRSAARSLAFHVADGLNYFALAKPEKLDGLNVVAVFGFDESGRFPFLRSRGPSPGAVFGVVTRDTLPAIDQWRLRHSPGLMFDETASSIKGAKDVGCMREDVAENVPVARARRPGDDAFDAGLAPKSR